MSKRQLVTLDVREDLKRGREPFSRIMAAVSALKPAEDLVLVAPFEPAPLYAVLANQGFDHVSRQLDSGDWEVRFSREPLAADAAPKIRAQKPSAPPCQGEPAVEVDTTGLEPPEPMVRILEVAATLPRGATLRARTERRPMHLYTQLEERGFVWQSEEQSDGAFLTTIRHK